jgi:chemotaxis signal transduction protein
MNSPEHKLLAKIDEMRQLFDESFSVPEQRDDKVIEHMLAVKLGIDNFAVCISDISGLTVAKGKILPVPSSVPELLGITGIRGVLVPVFSLAALLGISTGSGPCRWLVLCGERHLTIALAVDLVEGYLNVSADRIHAPGASSLAQYIKETIRDGDILRGVLDLAQVVQQIKAKGTVSVAK